MVSLVDVAQLRSEWPENCFLAQLPAKDLQAFLNAGRSRTFMPGSTLIEEGGLDSNVHLLLSSCVKISARLPGQAETLLAVRVGGNIVGEIAATDGSPRSATVRVCGHQPVTTVELTSRRFAELLEEHPRAAVLLAGSLGAKLRTANQRRIDYSGYPAVVRLARVLVELAEDHGYRPNGSAVMIGIDLTQVELGSLVGISEVTAQRALRELRQQALIATDVRRPLIRDINGLRTAARLPVVPRGSSV